MSIGPRMRNHVLELGRNQVCLSAVQSPVKSGTQLGLLWWGVFSGQRGRTRTRWYFPNTTEWIQSPALLRAQREAALSSLEPPIPLCGQGWKGPSPCRASGIRADRAHHLFSASLPESSGLAPSWDEPVFPACGLHFIYFFASCSKPLFFFLDRQGLAAPSGDVDLVEKNVLAVKQRAFLGLRFFKSQRFICFRKAEQWRLLVSRTHTCSLPRPPPSPPPRSILFHIRAEEPATVRSLSDSLSQWTVSSLGLWIPLRIWWKQRNFLQKIAHRCIYTILHVIRRGAWWSVFVNSEFDIPNFQATPWRQWLLLWLCIEHPHWGVQGKDHLSSLPQRTVVLGES